MEAPKFKNLLSYTNDNNFFVGNALKPNFPNYVEIQVFDKSGVQNITNTLPNPLNPQGTGLSKILDNNNFPFLGEAIVVGENIGICQRVVFFESLNIENGDIVNQDYTTDANNYRIGTLVLPPKFKFVNYKKNTSNQIEITKKNQDRDSFLIAPILIYFSNSSIESNPDEIDFFHICQLVNTAGGSEACKLLGISKPGQSFQLFFYSGELKLPGENEPTNSNFFLIPFVLSEGLITYFAIEEKLDGSHKTILNYLLENQIYIKYFEVPKPLEYNDDLGVFIFNEITFKY